MADNQDRAGATEGIPDHAPGEVDERLAANLRRWREKLGMSQADLAQKMSALGWRYHPQTINRIEHGQRKVTVGEAEALARIFDTTVDRLTWLEGDDAAAVLAGNAITRLRQSWHETADAVAHLLAARAGAQTAIRSLRASKSAKARAMADGIEDEMPGATLEEAVAEGEDRWQALREGR